MHRTPRRRWYAFNLRTLFVVVTLLAIGPAWVGRERYQSRRELEIITAFGGRAWNVNLVGPFDEPGTSSIFSMRSPYLPPQTRPWWRDTLATILGPRVESFSLIAPAGSDLTSLTRFSRLRRLGLHADPGTDLRPLTWLTQLESLSLTAPQVSEISALSGLVNLQELDLDGTQVSDLRPLARLVDLQELSLRGTRVCDLSPLDKLTNLRKIALDRSFEIDTLYSDAIESIRQLERNDPEPSDLTPLIELVQQQRSVALEASERNRQRLKLQQALPKCQVTTSSGSVY